MSKQVTRREFLYGFGVGLSGLFVRRNIITDWMIPSRFPMTATQQKTTAIFTVARFHNDKARIEIEYDTDTLDILNIKTRNAHTMPVKFELPLGSEKRTISTDGQLRSIDVKDTGLKLGRDEEGQLTFPIAYSTSSSSSRVR